MRKRIIGLLSFLVGGLWTYSWEFVRSFGYGRVERILMPYFDSSLLDIAGKWIPAAVFVSLGLLLFWWSGRHVTATEPPGTPQTKKSHKLFLGDSNAQTGRGNDKDETKPTQSI